MPESYRGQDRALTSLIGDYLALSIDWHAGDRLTADDFDPYAPTHRRNNQESPLSGLEKLRVRHQSSPVVDLAGRYLPFELASKAIVDGYASDEELAALLRQAGGFLHPLQEESWRTLWWWFEREDTQVATAYADVRRQISGGTFVEPDLILHVWGILLEFASKNLFELNAEGVVSEAHEYLDRLVRERRLLPTEQPERIGLGPERDASYGLGFQSRETPEFSLVRDALQAALIASSERDAPLRLRALIADLRNDPIRFFVALVQGGDRRRGIPDLQEQQIFLAADPQSVAGEVFDLSPDRWRTFLSPMRDRQRHLDFRAGQAGQPPNRERQWLLDFRNRARELAEAATPIRRAQILWAVNHHLAFLDPPSEPPNS